ncbi:MAG: hypothetical protein HY320_13875 [Armatimonadetes bacterium]|nr:hypothetical protein [Armatimonadota bacterium]
MEPPANFRFVEPGRIALSGAPETIGQVDWLHAQGIRGVLSLHPVGDEIARRMKQRGIDWLPFVLEDLGRAPADALRPALAFLERHAKEDPACLVH